MLEVLSKSGLLVTYARRNSITAESQRESNQVSNLEQNAYQGSRYEQHAIESRACVAPEHHDVLGAPSLTLQAHHPNVNMIPQHYVKVTCITADRVTTTRRSCLRCHFLHSSAWSTHPASPDRSDVSQSASVADRTGSRPDRVTVVWGLAGSSRGFPASMAPRPWDSAST